QPAPRLPPDRALSEVGVRVSDLFGMHGRNLSTRRLAAVTASAAIVPRPPADPGNDDARRRGLRRMRMVATGLLVLAAVVYAVTLGQGGGWGYVHAAAEASMVGAIAD